MSGTSQQISDADFVESYLRIKAAEENWLRDLHIQLAKLPDYCTSNGSETGKKRREKWMLREKWKRERRMRYRQRQAGKEKRKLSEGKKWAKKRGRERDMDMK